MSAEESTQPLQQKVEYSTSEVEQQQSSWNRVTSIQVQGIEFDTVMSMYREWAPEYDQVSILYPAL